MGRVEESLKHFDAAEAADNPQGQNSPAYWHFFQAMAHHRLGHKEAARNWLAKAVAETEKELLAVAQDPIAGMWVRKATLELLRAEAQALLSETAAKPEKRDVSGWRWSIGLDDQPAVGRGQGVGPVESQADLVDHAGQTEQVPGIRRGDVGIAQEVAGEEVLDRVQADDAGPEQAGAGLLAAEGQPAAPRRLGIGRSKVFASAAGMVVISCPSRTGR